MKNLIYGKNSLINGLGGLSILVIILFTATDVEAKADRVNLSEDAMFSRCGSDDVDGFRLARVTGGKNQRTYFYGVSGEDFSFPINASDTNMRRTKSYLVSGDKVLILKSNDKWACSWFQPPRGKGTIGLLPIKTLRDVIVDKPKTNDWTGIWYFASSAKLYIRQGTRRGFLRIRGAAEALTRHGRIHNDWSEFVAAQPSINRIRLNLGQRTVPGDDCEITIRLLGRYLVASDNKQCGVGHITFDGVYRKRRPT